MKGEQGDVVVTKYSLSTALPKPYFVADAITTTGEEGGAEMLLSLSTLNVSHIPPVHVFPLLGSSCHLVVHTTELTEAKFISAVNPVMSVVSAVMHKMK